MIALARRGATRSTIALARRDATRSAIALCTRLVLFAASVSGCKPDGSTPGKLELAVFAASSLSEAFRDLEDGFEALHPDVDLKSTFAGSQVLRLQIEQGASASVFASANEGHMQALVDSGYVSRSQAFARNELVVIVPETNPAAIETFADLGKASRIVIGTDNVPVGIYTRQMLERAGAALGEAFLTEVERRIVSEEANVRLVRAKVEMGEADAAVVYRTDAASSDRVHVVPIPSAFNVRAQYTLGTLANAPHRRAADQFVAYLLSSAGREVLRRHDFLVEVE